eukprot:525590_1
MKFKKLKLNVDVNEKWNLKKYGRYDVLNNEFWDRWQLDRKKDKNIEVRNNKKIDITVEGIKPKEIQIINELKKTDIEEEEKWDIIDKNDFEDDNYFEKKKIKKNNNKNIQFTSR